MRCGDYRYLWQRPDWPEWRWDTAAIAAPLADTSRAQGALIGRLADVGLPLREGSSLDALTADVLGSAGIEGEELNVESVRSSIARRLGVDIGALAPVDRNVEGMVEVVLDATVRCREPLTSSRVFAWHAALFPTGRSGLSDIRVGAWRDDTNGPMQVVSGPVHRHRVHYEAPPASRVDADMRRLLAWIDTETSEPSIIRSAVAHLWFLTVHPFDDGNGRIARAVGDLLLARGDGSSLRFYSVSAQIERERRDYYAILERIQKGTLDITEWLDWFLAALARAIDTADATLDTVFRKSRFWQRWSEQALNPRQTKLVNRLLDGFDGRMTSSRWASIAKCSPDTALRDINALIALGILERAPGGGRSTSYELTDRAS